MLTSKESECSLGGDVARASVGYFKSIALATALLALLTTHLLQQTTVGTGQSAQGDVIVTYDQVVSVGNGVFGSALTSEMMATSLDEPEVVAIPQEDVSCPEQGCLRPLFPDQDRQFGFAVPESIFIGNDGPRRIRIASRNPNPSNAELFDNRNALVATTPIQPWEEAFIDFTPNTKVTENWRLVITTSDGVVQEQSILMTYNWSVMYLLTQGPTLEPCSVVTWSYDPTLQPAAATQIKSDFAAALNHLAARTGLTFVEAAGAERGQIHFIWDPEMRFPNYGQGRVTAHSGGKFTLTVALNPDRKYRVTWSDRNAGLGRPLARLTKPGTLARKITPAGRSWLVMHEILHVLGFDHSPDKKSVMYPVHYGQKAFSKADLEGLEFLYASKCRDS